LAAWLTVLLQRMDKLVCDEVTARLCLRLIITGCEDDVSADRVCQRIDGTRALRSASVRVYANSSEVVAQLRLHEQPRRFVEVVALFCKHIAHDVRGTKRPGRTERAPLHAQTIFITLLASASKSRRAAARALATQQSFVLLRRNRWCVDFLRRRYNRCMFTHGSFTLPLLGLHCTLRLIPRRKDSRRDPRVCHENP